MKIGVGRQPKSGISTPAPTVQPAWFSLVETLVVPPAVQIASEPDLGVVPAGRSQPFALKGQQACFDLFPG
jgi:hypothetical protein